jgi:hypothetical protein
VAEQLGDDHEVGPAAHERGRERVPEDMIVPTSAQASLCRPPRYADLDKHVLADSIIVALGSA